MFSSLYAYSPIFVLILLIFYLFIAFSSVLFSHVNIFLFIVSYIIFVLTYCLYIILVFSTPKPEKPKKRNQRWKRLKIMFSFSYWFVFYLYFKYEMIALNLPCIFQKESGQTVKNCPSYASTNFQYWHLIETLWRHNLGSSAPFCLILFAARTHGSALSSHANNTSQRPCVTCAIPS